MRSNFIVIHAHSENTLRNVLNAGFFGSVEILFSCESLSLVDRWEGEPASFFEGLPRAFFCFNIYQRYLLLVRGKTGTLGELV